MFSGNENASDAEPAVDEKYMLDTTAFNLVLDGRMSLAVFARSKLLVTGIQADELRATPNPERRAELLATFEKINPVVLPASSFTLGIEGAGLGQAYWNDGSGRAQKMLECLQGLDGKRSIHNQLRDILIAETAIKNGATLITGDANLGKVVLQFGGRCVSPSA